MVLDVIRRDTEEVEIMDRWDEREKAFDKVFDGDTPEEIIDRAVLHMRKIEDKYPKESRELSSDGSNFAHGFNSGCLAAFRYVITALDHKKVYCEEMEEFVPRGGIDMANEMFPWLDT